MYMNQNPTGGGGGVLPYAPLIRLQTIVDQYMCRPANLWESKTVFCDPKNCIFPPKTVFYNKMRTAMQIKKKTSHTSELPTYHFQKKYYWA